MVEKFSDYEGGGYLASEGEFVFEVMSAELKDSAKGTPMVVLEVKCDKGTTSIYHSLNKNAKWSYNNLIKCCLGLNTPEKIAAFECDYELIHNDLIGKKFVGVVEKDYYVKEVKIPQDDGTFLDGTEEKTTYKIKEYKFC